MKECIKRRHPKTKKKRKKMEKVCGPMTKKYSTVTKMRRDDGRYEEDGGAPPTSSSPTSSHYGKTKCSHTSLSSSLYSVCPHSPRLSLAV